MKCFSPEIAWNSKEAIYAVDFQPNEVQPGVFRLASGGIDKEIKIWWISNVTDSGQPEFRSSLKSHQGTVNTLRFSPDGKFLASGDVDGLIVLWQLSPVAAAPDIFADEETAENKEKWEVYKRLRSHLEDVSDLAWSRDSMKLLSASVDKSVIVWDVSKGSHVKMLKQHKHYVVGLAWDPMDKLCVSMAQDRSFNVYAVNNGYQRIANVSKAEIPDILNPEQLITVKLFHDDSMMSFARRPDFSPDGELLFVPAGCVESGVESRNVSFVYCRHEFEKPALILPSSDKPTVAVRCCPILFELRDDPDSPSLFKLPYRILFAVLSLDSVTFYDTQHLFPIAFISNIHYANLTDLAWSQDGRLLVVSSIDAFCSVIVFEENELGVPVEPTSNLESNEEMDVSALDETEILMTPISDDLPKQVDSTPRNNWSSSEKPPVTDLETPRRKRIQLLPASDDTSVVSSPQTAPTDSPQQNQSGEVKAPRRIQLMTLSNSPQTLPGQGATLAGCRSTPPITPAAAAVEAEIVQAEVIAVDPSPTQNKKPPRRVPLVTLD